MLKPETAELRIRTASDGYKICVVAEQANARKPRRKWILAGADAWDVEPPGRFEPQQYPYRSLESAQEDAARIFPTREEFQRFLQHRVSGADFFENEFSDAFVPSAWDEEPSTSETPELPNGLFDESRDVQSYMRRERPFQQAFKRAVFERYGARCSLCRIDAIELLDAAHVIAWAAKGADVPENGLPLCKVHHAAIDRGLVKIDPDSLDVLFRDGIAAHDFHVESMSIRHLPAQPARAALQWLFSNADRQAGRLDESCALRSVKSLG